MIFVITFLVGKRGRSGAGGWVGISEKRSVVGVGVVLVVGMCH